MNFLSSSWFVMILALVLHLAGYFGALMTHQFEMPVFEEEVEEVVTIEEILENKKQDVDWYFKTDELDKFIEELNSRKADLDRREAELLSLQNHINVEKQELDELKAEIQRRHETLSEQIIIVKQSELSNLKSLASSYTNLSPEATVRIFNEMDGQLVIKILALMKPERVAAVLEEMVKQGGNNQNMIRRAAALSEQLRLHYKEQEQSS